MTAVLVMSTVLLGPRCAAQVLTTVEEAGPADCVYIAGNPDLYPIEYYDSEQQCYRGILPELLGMVAEDTGISFAYVNAGSEDSRLEMARNSQVEMVTAFRRGEFSRMVLPVQRTVLTTETDGRETAICVGFTGIIKEELRERIVEALEAIPEEDKTTLAISFTMGQEPQAGWKKARLAGAAALAAAAATLLILGIIRHGKRKKSQENAMLDPLTGLGNAQCYEAARTVQRKRQQFFSELYRRRKKHPAACAPFIPFISLQFGFDLRYVVIKGYAAFFYHVGLYAPHGRAKLCDPSFLKLCGDLSVDPRMKFRAFILSASKSGKPLVYSLLKLGNRKLFVFHSLNSSFRAYRAFRFNHHSGLFRNFSCGQYVQSVEGHFRQYRL